MHHKTGRSALRADISSAQLTPAKTSLIMMFLAFSICTLMLFSVPAFAQSSALDLPANASAKSYGEGWECNLGYRVSGDICAAIIVPKNAYATNLKYGVGWECAHGFHAQDASSCVAVIVPAGGFLDPSGERWSCLRGYFKVDDTCQKITLPEHAYLNDTSDAKAWTCSRGFEAAGDICSAIEVPDNAYLNTSGYGNPWNCERGFIAKNDLCQPVITPENAYFDDSTYGKGWKCDRGYAATGDSCAAINTPMNAHLDRSGNRWECDKNFRKSKGQCAIRN